MKKRILVGLFIGLLAVIITLANTKLLPGLITGVLFGLIIFLLRKIPSKLSNNKIITFLQNMIALFCLACIISLLSISLQNGIVSIGSFWGVSAFFGLFTKKVNDIQQKIPENSRIFGYKQSWLCVSSENPSLVAKTLGIENTKPCGWKFGLRGRHEGCFISPPVNGWIFVVGEGLVEADKPEKIKQWLNILSKSFGIANYFMSFRSVDCYLWARSENGKLVRGYSTGEVLEWNEGKVISGLDDKLWNGEDEINQESRIVDEDLVMDIARHWCVAPGDLTPEEGEPVLGIIEIVDKSKTV